jgi:putative transposase
MTRTGFEEWLVTFICKVYHQNLHHGIGMAPRLKWETGIFGNAEVQGIGLPPRPADRLTVLLDFLPSFRRTVQTSGVTIDGLTYYAEALRPWINVEDPERPDRKREFIFRRDPRDISTVWFRDPVLNQYFKIPFADQSLPSLSIWEYRQARDWLRREGLASANEAQILRALTELRQKVEAPREKTKKARRQAQRRAEYEREATPAEPVPVSKEPSAPVPTALGLEEGELAGFEEIR